MSPKTHTPPPGLPAAESADQDMAVAHHMASTWPGAMLVELARNPPRGTHQKSALEDTTEAAAGDTPHVKTAKTASKAVPGGLRAVHCRSQELGRQKPGAPRIRKQGPVQPHGPPSALYWPG